MKLPSFLVKGAAKGGTTSLHFYLRQHPDIYLSPAKETNFYWQEGRSVGRRIPATIDEYASFFAGAAAERAVGEISPQYLNSPTAAERIHADLPGIRLVVSLRDPADRAWSDYLGRVRTAQEHRPPEEAIRPGERILEHGFYYPRLTRFFDLFPRERIHVMLYYDFARNPSRALRELFAFLGIARDVPLDTSTVHNQAATSRWPTLNRLLWMSVPMAQRLVPRRLRGSGLAEAVLRKTYGPAPPFPEDLRRRLRSTYREDILATADLTQKDLSDWLT